MKKLNIRNELVEYSLEDEELYLFVVDWEIKNPTQAPTLNPNIECNCGSKKFGVCWWDYPYTGGYCKITCSKYGEELVLIDDYS